MNESELIKAVVAGNTGAFNYLMNQYKPLVTGIVFRLVKDQMQAEEVCQDVFIRVYQHLSQFKGESKLSTWIAGIAYNRSKDYLKRKKLLLIDNLYSSESEERFDFISQIKDDSPDALAVREKEDVGKIMAIYIEKLPLQYKTLLVLFHYEEFTLKEIAEITKLPEGTVKSYIFRARKALKELLEKHTNVKNLLYEASE